MASDHIARGYDEELRKLNNTVAEMGGLAESQLGTAIEAVITRDTELAARVVEGDVKIDQFEREIDNLAIRLLALRQPVEEEASTTIIDPSQPAAPAQPTARPQGGAGSGGAPPPPPPPPPPGVGTATTHPAAGVPPVPPPTVPAPR